MNKKVIALSLVTVATLAVAKSPTHADLQSQINQLQTQLNSMSSSSSSSLEKKVASLEKTVSKVRAHDAGDNIKWNVDFRTTMDKLIYTHNDGTKSKNNSLLTNRLLLGMKFKADENVIFYGTLAFNKAFGDTANHSQSNTQPGYADFDWVTNENALDGNLRVKEAYWLYQNSTFLGKDMAWSASIGRRPSTGGLGINFREGDKRKSALSHTVNVEFDGASFKWALDKVTPLTGGWIKLCMGRGLTNAKPRFDMKGEHYAKDDTLNENVDMYGLIFVPYDDGQYSVHTNYAKATGLIGFDMNAMGQVKKADGTFTNDFRLAAFYNQGDLDLSTIMFKADGIGDEINDFLDNTTLFISYAQSKTKPGAGKAMLGSMNSETGHSTWVGIQTPGFAEGDRFGLEWNKGSKYWRGVTYAEDTMAGSKIAARGTAVEAYYLKPLTKALSMDIRFTKIEYDYTGSNAFFGADGTPMEVSNPMAQNPVKEATDLRVGVRYRF